MDRSRAIEAFFRRTDSVSVNQYTLWFVSGAGFVTGIIGFIAGEDLGTRVGGSAPPLRPSGEKVLEGRMRGETDRLSNFTQSLNRQAELVLAAGLGRERRQRHTE